MKHYDYEEDFHAKDRKQFRKERKIAQSTDRSKFKKTDLDRRVSAPEIASHLPRGRVIAISGEGAWIESEGNRILCTLKGLLKKEKGHSKNLIAVGDWVRFSDNSLIQVEERTSFLSRADITGRQEQLIAVNIDQAMVTVSIGNPPLKPALVDRYLIALEKGNIRPIIVINKIDLLPSIDAEEQQFYRTFLADYEPLGYPILSVSTVTGDGIDALRSLLQHKTSVFSGQSGAGKSSLLNACFGLSLKTGELSQKTQKGSHTTTTAELLPLPGGGYCVDTPGIRSFAIWNLQPTDLIHHYRDIAKFATRCQFPDCVHLEEPNCAVRKAVEKKKLSALRYNSFQSLFNEIRGGPDQRTRKKMEEDL
ncbi:MAG: ribosome small subunit-dependent GTPase A [Chlamydiia bacterium]|nr:ribosome small subunit-dependent GTPase A [Chlamydiia bacterium]